ncbi:hypothetical protein ACRARG_16480 [Pseudooceanicola sp. C21-150M6]
MTSGEASARFVHIATDGKATDICTLHRDAEGSAYTPPLHCADLDGRVEVEITAAPDSRFDLYIGTNQRPEDPIARLAVAVDARQDPQLAAALTDARAELYREFAITNALELVLLTDRPAEAEPDLPDGLTRLVRPETPGLSGTGLAIYHALYGQCRGRGLTHVAVLDPGRGAQCLDDIQSLLGFTQYLRPGVQLATAAATGGTGWATHLFNARDIHENGLPHAAHAREDGTEYLSRMIRAGRCRIVSPANLGGAYQPRDPGVPPKIEAPKKIGYFARVLRGARPPSEIRPGDAAFWSAVQTWRRVDSGVPLTQLALTGAQDMANTVSESDSTSDMFLALRASRDDLVRTAKSMIEPLEDRMHHAGLADPARVRADLDRASRTMLSLLRNRHQGTRVYIVGNGPSLDMSDLDRMSGEVSFASNKIFLAYDQTSWRPTYYSVEDHLVLRNSMEQIHALQDSIKIFPEHMRNHGYHAADTVFMPLIPPKSFDEPLSDPDFPGFSRDLSHGVHWGSTIVYTQIQLALFMGAAEIVLIGVDHSYRLPDTKRGNTYKYDGEINHFHPEYRAEGEVWHKPNLDVLEVSYQRARDICDAAGVRIVNASRKTELTVFDRASLDDLLPGAAS